MVKENVSCVFISCKFIFQDNSSKDIFAAYLKEI